MELKDLQREMMLMDIIKERNEVILNQSQYINKLEEDLKVKNDPANAIIVQE